jgi:hypothetical protein
MPIFRKKNPCEHNPPPDDKRPDLIITPPSPHTSTHPPMNVNAPMPPVKPTRDDREMIVPIFMTTHGLLKPLVVVCAECGQQIRAYYRCDKVVAEKCPCIRKEGSSNIETMEEDE